MSSPVTIITSVYSATDEFLINLSKSVKKQRYSGKIRHIMINDNIKRKIPEILGVKVINHSKNIGLAKTLNEGFKLAKTDIIVSLMDDCVPASNKWLSGLVSPLEDKKVAATTSDVELPEKFWNGFSYFARALTEKEQRIIVPGLDEKGCAYRKSAIKEFGYLNDKEFTNGGEDTDLTMKIERSGKWHIVHTRARVFHYHYFSAKSRLKKEIQYAKLSGLVSRKYFFRLPWNFKLHVSARILVALFFLYSLISGNALFISALLVLLLSNIRLPSQIKRLGLSIKTIGVVALNILVYLLYVYNYIYALLFKPRV